MDKEQIALQIRKISPGLYRIVHGLYRCLDMPRYIISRAIGRPYFGPLMLSAQTWPSRQPHMRKAIQNKIKEVKQERCDILEIGSWAGQSAILWGTELLRSESPGKVFCVDPWAPFSNGNQVGSNKATLQMDRVATRDKIFPLFWHNVRSSGLSDLVFPIRCKSKDILTYLKPESFDLVFVDGSHAIRTSFTIWLSSLP